MAIRLEQVTKTYQGNGISYTALKGIDFSAESGEFVAIVGKSGSGKSTLMNMITGIDKPTSGRVTVAGTELTALRPSKLARWRGTNLGVIFQFFQLLPTLSLLENVMLPMDFCGMYRPAERKVRALELLDRVGMAEHANKLPSAISGGQQQRVAIARSLANDPAILLADEPTGSLDSKTADAVFQLFAELARSGKTVVMVTHDNDLARKVDRSVIVADGEIVNQYVLKALPNLDVDLLTLLQPRLLKRNVAPGGVILREGDEADYAYIIVQGEVDVFVQHPSGQEIRVKRLTIGQYFGEIALMQGGKRTATVKASSEGPVSLLAIDRETFGGIMAESALTREEMDLLIRNRLGELAHLRSPL